MHPAIYRKKMGYSINSITFNTEPTSGSFIVSLKLRHLGRKTIAGSHSWTKIGRKIFYFDQLVNDGTKVGKVRVQKHDGKKNSSLASSRQGIDAALVFRWGYSFKFLESIGEGIAVVKATFLGNSF